MTFYAKANMIFLASRRFEVNLQAGFRKDFTLNSVPGSIVLRITGRTFYKVFLNGEFVFYGPARAAHENARVDIVDIGAFVRIGTNQLAIEVAGYNVGNLYVTGEYSFVMAEVECDGDVILWTDDQWKGVELKHKRGYAENFSHARCVSELYDLDAGYYRWRTAPEGYAGSTRLAVQPTEVIHDPITLLDRGSGPPDFQTVRYARLLNVSSIVMAPDGERISSYPMMKHGVPETASQGPIERPVVDCKNDRDMPFSGRIEFGAASGPTNAQEITVHANTAATALDFDFVEMASAFPGIEFTCDRSVTIDLVHADKLTESGGFDPRNCYSVTVIRLHCEAGRYRFEAFEPYGVRYLRVVVRGAARFTLHDVFMRRCQYPDLKGGSFLCSDSGLNRIYDAANLNLRMNTFDTFLDCPGRERGAWVSDSFWTARAARLIYGETKVERAHLENYLADSLKKYFPDFIPACYPAKEECRIHCWTMHLGIQLCEYYRRTADRNFFDERAAQVERMVGTLSRYENRFGLLQDLPEIVYVDGTIAANDLHNRPVSTGANGLYAKMLRGLGEIYHRDDWIGKARAIVDILRRVCDIEDTDDFGRYVPDSFAIDDAGAITRGRYSSEGAQYVCMWTGLIDRKRLPGLYQLLFDEFGPHPVVPISNNRRTILGSDLFVGTGYRFEVLHEQGENRRLMNEMTHLYLYMIDHGPGTLWEGWGRGSNINHGYPSHAAVWLFKSFLGLNIPDEVQKTIEIAPHPCGRKWAKGYTRAGSGVVSVSWMCEQSKFTMDVGVPDGYGVDVNLPDEFLGWTVRLRHADGHEAAAIAQGQTGIRGIARSFRLEAVPA